MNDKNDENDEKMNIFEDEKTSIYVGVFFWGSLAAALPAGQTIMGICLVLLGVFFLYAVLLWVKMLLDQLF